MVLFRKAQYIWPTGREKEKNLSVGFVVTVGKGDYDIYLAASTLYRMFVVFLALAIHALLERRMRESGLIRR